MQTCPYLLQRAALPPTLLDALKDGLTDSGAAAAKRKASESDSVRITKAKAVDNGDSQDLMPSVSETAIDR